ncbi:MAG TPA: hypothetical protein VGE40_00005 [Bacilli bacterium]
MENQLPESIHLGSPFIQRRLSFTAGGMTTDVYETLPGHHNLLAEPTHLEGIVTINNHEWTIGASDGFIYSSHMIHYDSEGGKRAELKFAAPAKLNADGLTITLIYELSGRAPVLIKSALITNDSRTAVKVDNIRVEQILSSNLPAASLVFENDFVRGAMCLPGEQNAPFSSIENQISNSRSMAAAAKEEAVFQYPGPLEHWLAAGERFQSFRVYEFAITNENEESRSLQFKRATRELFPWTRQRFLSCMLAPAKRVEEYHIWMESAAEAGYEGVILNHGWFDGVIFSPVFTNYADYQPNPELFPEGWADVNKLTAYAHSLGLRILFYTTYITMWDDMESKAAANNQWELIWAPEDNSMRWGRSLCPGSDWGPYVNAKLDEAVKLGGFDGVLLDSPYLGDACINTYHGHLPGSSSQAIGWKRQIEFYGRMQAAGYYVCAAQGFAAFAHGANRFATSGYDEGEFGTLGVWAQIMATRKGAYEFTKVYRQEQGEYYVPIVPWLGGEGMEPLEEHAEEYNAYLANCFGYGFEGTTYQRLSYYGPKTEQIVKRWIGFWKTNAAYFKQGDLIHISKPDGKNLDAVLHLLQSEDETKALLVVYNPLEQEQTGVLKFPFFEIGLAANQQWAITDEADRSLSIMRDDHLSVTVPRRNAIWLYLTLQSR